MNIENQINPFKVTSPEDMTAKDTEILFVNVFTDFPKIIDPGHVFLNGPRGSGKSMMFRYLKPDCQIIAKKCKISELPFLGIYIPIKNTSLAELDRLKGHANILLNSHLLVTHFSLFLFKDLLEVEITQQKGKALKAANSLYNEIFIPLLNRSSWKGNIPSSKNSKTVSELLKKMESVCYDMYDEVKRYIASLSFESTAVPYNGALSNYLDFLYPLLLGIKELPFLPNGPLYLMIDDADNLSEDQTKIVNSWVATRTSSKVSLKISTQLGYKTYYTVAGSTIDTPHDYSDINISTIYTSNRKKYRARIIDIVKKRLAQAKIGTDPIEFFPEDKKQEEEIRKRKEEYIQKHKKGKGRGTSLHDDANRYARPDYIRDKAGRSRSSHTYSYAGFDQLVHLSSGIVRYFLQPAHTMFSETLSNYPSKEVSFIPQGIQNSVARDEAAKFLFDDLEKEEKDKSKDAYPKDDIRKLSNLIHALGSMFRQCLMSDRSERRVFSIAFSDNPSDEVLKIIDLGVRLGYFHKSTKGKKDSLSGGRTRLYILSRRLSPIWTLDPAGFAGYLFVTDKFIKEALVRPSSLLRRLTKKGIDNELDSGQLNLPFKDE